MSSVFAELRGNKRKPAETEGSSKTRWWSRSWSRRYKTVRGHVGRSRERHWSLELGRGNPKHPAVVVSAKSSHRYPRACSQLMPFAQRAFPTLEEPAAPAPEARSSIRRRSGRDAGYRGRPMMKDILRDRKRRGFVVGPARVRKRWR